MANKVKIKANRGGIRYFGAWGQIPREVRGKLASYKPTRIDASYLAFMDPTSYEMLEEKAEDIKVEDPVSSDSQADSTAKVEEKGEPKPKNTRKKPKKKTLDPSTEEEKTESLKED